ncbi:hypothetical protein GBAR_LOCUS26507, partial [Geodia barretti]
GEVTFNEEGARRISTVTLLQYRSSGITGDVSEVKIAEYDIGNGDLVYLPEESNATVFPDGVTPDGTPRNVTVSFYLALVCYLLHHRWSRHCLHICLSNLQRQV